MGSDLARSVDFEEFDPLLFLNESLRTNNHIAPITKLIPQIWIQVMGSDKTAQPIKRVETGPRIPACATRGEPMRLIATMISSMGMTVQRLALNRLSQ